MLDLALSVESIAKRCPGVAAVQTIGGTAIGAAGTVGTYTEGFLLSGGDDFDSALDIITPATPFGKYGTTRGCYIVPVAGQQPRGSTGLGGWDVDPLWTGHLDSNRGAKISSLSDMITQSGGVLTLNQRTATAPEQTHLGRAVNCLSSMIHTGFAMLARPPFVIEWKEQRTANAVSHMTGWTHQPPFRSQDALQLNFEADSQAGGVGDGTKVDANVSVWTTGAVTESGRGGTAVQSPSQATTHTYAFKIDATGDCTLWLDGTLIRTYTGQEALALARSHFLQFTNHVFDAQWAGSPAPYDIHWYRFWRVSTGAHHTPSTPTLTINADSGAAFSSTLATQATLWGGAVTEQVQACMADPNEPGGTVNGVTYADLPTGITYNSGTRALAGTLTTPGRLNIVRYVDQGGDTCVPQRIAVNIGPKINITQVNATAAASGTYDLYAQCDCGVLTSDSSGAKAKTISVTGMPTGVSYSDSTGILTWTSAITAATTAMTVTVTNSIGQATAATTVNFIAASGNVTFLSDSFTGASGSLTSHSPETGSTWSTVTGSTGTAPTLFGVGSIYVTGASGVTATANAVTPTNGANYYVEAAIICRSAKAGDSAGVIGRCDTAANTYYTVRYAVTGTSWQLFKVVSGTATALGSAVTDAGFTAGVTRTVRLTMNGSTISVDIDGVTQVTLTDSSITAAGKAGVRFGNVTNTSSTGLHLDSLVGVSF